MGEVAGVGDNLPTPIPRPVNEKPKRFLFYLVAGGNLEVAETDRVVQDVDAGGWWIYHNDSKNTVTFVVAANVGWVRSWDAS